MTDKTQQLADSLNNSLIQSQVIYLNDAQNRLKYGPTEMARMLGTPFNTYKAWLYGNNPMPGVVRVALDCILGRMGV